MSDNKGRKQSRNDEAPTPTHASNSNTRDASELIALSGLRQSKISNVIQGLMFLATLGAVGFALAAYNQTREILELDKRPVVLVRSGRPSHEKGAGRIQWNFGQINYGVLPAVRSRHRARVLIGIGPPLDAAVARYFAELPDPLPPQDGPGTIIPPRPNDDPPAIFSTGFSLETVSADVFERHLAGGEIALVGRIEYSSISGRRYRTDFCLRWLTSGSPLNCRRYNEMGGIPPEND